MPMDFETLHWFSGAVQAIYAARTYAELHRSVVPCLHARFHSIISMCESASEDGSQFSSDAMTGQITVPADYALYLWDHPNVIRLLDGTRRQVLHLRGAVSRESFERTDYFNALCRSNALHDQILTVAWQPHRLTSFAVNRDRMFSAEERLLLEWLQPHLNAAVHRIGAHQAAGAPPFGDPWVALDALLRPVWLAPGQRHVLQSYFPAWKGGLGLPVEMRDWLQDVVRRLAEGVVARPLCALFVEQERGRLGVRYYPPTAGRGPALRLTETPAEVGRFWRQCQLTAREREVLGWLAQGKRNAEIAAILGISPLTVGKHVERILKKMGIHSRNAAGRLAGA